MAGSRVRRWPRRLAALTILVAAVAALRERKLAENARRFGLPG